LLHNRDNWAIPKEKKINRREDTVDGHMRALIDAMRVEHSRHIAAADFYQNLATCQRPGVVVICCSDSRAAPEHIARANPGALFVERSVAGLVPPPPGMLERTWLRAYGAVTRALGMRQLAGAWYATWAAIEYPVMHLKVPNILILGHSGCGGVALACQRRGRHSELHDTDCWVDMIRPMLHALRYQHGPASDDQTQKLAEHAAILWSRANLLKHRGIAMRVRAGQTAVHAAYYDIASGVVSFFDPACDAFIPLDGSDTRSLPST
jgi:carbonic anhydrase